MSNDKTKASTTQQPSETRERQMQDGTEGVSASTKATRYVTYAEFEQAFRDLEQAQRSYLQEFRQLVMREGPGSADRPRPRREKLHRRTLPDDVKKERAAAKKR